MCCRAILNPYSLMINRMKKNVGGIDRTLRIILGLGGIAAGLYLSSWWGLVGVVILMTGLFRFCGLYTLIGVSTCPLETAPPAPPATPPEA